MMLEIHICVITNSVGKSPTYFSLLFKNTGKPDLKALRCHKDLLFTAILMSKVLGKTVFQHRQTSEMLSVTSPWNV